MDTNTEQGIWIFLCGQLVMFVGWVVGGGYYLGKVLQRFSDLAVRTGKLEEKTTRIDEHGTTFSQYNIKSDTEKITEIATRVAKLELNARKLDVVADRVERISTHILEKLK